MREPKGREEEIANSKSGKNGEEEIAYLNKECRRTVRNSLESYRGKIGGKCVGEKNLFSFGKLELPFSFTLISLSLLL